MVLDEEIKEMAEKLERLQRRSGVKELEVRNCGNFDKKASLLRRRLKKFGGESDESCAKEIQERAEASLSIKTTCRVNDPFVSTSSCNVIFSLSLSLFFPIRCNHYATCDSDKNGQPMHYLLCWKRKQLCIV